jgi:hypothetical protein
MMYAVTSMQKERVSGRIRLAFLSGFTCKRTGDAHQVCADWVMQASQAITFTNEARAELVADLVHDWCNVSVVDVVEVGA